MSTVEARPCARRCPGSGIRLDRRALVPVSPDGRVCVAATWHLYEAMLTLRRVHPVSAGLFRRRSDRSWEIYENGMPLQQLKRIPQDIAGSPIMDRARKTFFGTDGRFQDFNRTHGPYFPCSCHGSKGAIAAVPNRTGMAHLSMGLVASRCDRARGGCNRSTDLRAKRPSNSDLGWYQ